MIKTPGYLKSKTRGVTLKKQLPLPLAEQELQKDPMHMLVRETLFILLLALGLFFILSLATYHRGDPGWSVATENIQVKNLGGFVGAWFADLFYYLFGLIAYVFPLGIFAIAWQLLRGKLRRSLFRWHLFSIKSIGFVLALLTGCGLFSLFLLHLPFTLPMGSGGVMGSVVANEIRAEFNLWGATLLMLAIFLSGVTVSTGLSWGDALSKLLKLSATFASHGTQKLKSLIGALFAKIKSLPRKKRVQPVFGQEKVEPAPKFSMPLIKKTTSKPKPTISKPKTEEKPVSRPKVVKKNQGSLPSLDLLEVSYQDNINPYSKAELESLSQQVEARLLDFGVKTSVVAVHPGPVITRFELSLAPGIKVSKITGLAKDLARALSIESVRVVEVIPGKPVVGLEIPNQNREIVRLKEIFSSNAYGEASSPLSLALGKDIAGASVVVDLAKMPHLLVAGTTGSGKSVGLNAMLLSLLYKSQPDIVKLIMIDPKMLELSVYDGIPHLLTPVVTDMKEAGNALKWCVVEMERRYQLMAALGVRNMQGFNQKIKEAIDKGSPLTCPITPPNPDEPAPELEPLPYLIVVVDEFADMIMVVGKKVEELIARIAQKARAAGIHLILATQRPSVDVITGLIKANVPTRIAFQVASRVDSRTILDQQGAEQLLGRGDMLYLPPGTGIPMRVHGAYVADHEVHQVVDAWKEMGEPEYNEDILMGQHKTANFAEAQSASDGEADPLYDEAVMIVTQSRRASISMVQRRLKIGYNRSARLIEQMEMSGVVSPMQSNGTREVLAPPPPK